MSECDGKNVVPGPPICCDARALDDGGCKYLIEINDIKKNIHVKLCLRTINRE